MDHFMIKGVGNPHSFLDRKKLRIKYEQNGKIYQFQLFLLDFLTSKIIIRCR